MSETGVKPARRKIWKFLLWWMLASLLLLAGLGWYQHYGLVSRSGAPPPGGYAGTDDRRAG